MISGSYIELNKAAIRNNFEFLKKIYGSDVKISSVVKANAYGHGIEKYVPLVEEQGINHFSAFVIRRDSYLHGAPGAYVQARTPRCPGAPASLLR